jgi:hypothetical protein
MHPGVTQTLLGVNKTLPGVALTVPGVPQKLPGVAQTPPTVDPDKGKVENGDLSDFHFFTIYDYDYMWLKCKPDIVVQFSQGSP